MAWPGDAAIVGLIKAKRVALPTYPGVALQLQRLMATADYGVADLARLVEADQALATAVIRSANSLFYGFTAPITALGPAIARVGASSLNTLAIALTLAGQGTAEGPLASLRRESWRRSLMSAQLCHHLARHRGLDPGEAFLAGLLHDFGETIACTCFETLLLAHPELDPRAPHAWQAQLQRYHVELGMALSAEWKLPAFVSEVVMRHHDAEPTGDDFPEMVQLVALSDALVARVAAASSLEELALETIDGLDVSERAPLEALLRELPAFLASFDAPRGAGPRPVDRTPSMVAPVTSALGDHARPVHWRLEVFTRDLHEPYRAVAMSPTALCMEGAHPQPERHLIHLDLGSVKVFATVVRCVASKAGFEIDVKPFAMDRAAKAAWSRLLHASDGEEAPVSAPAARPSPPPSSASAPATRH